MRLRRRYYDDPAVIARIDALVAAAPPPTPEQIAEIYMILGPIDVHPESDADETTRAA